MYGLGQMQTCSLQMAFFDFLVYPVSVFFFVFCFVFCFAVVLGFNAWDWPLSLLAISMNPLLLTDSSYQVVENIPIKQLAYKLEISMR